MSLLKINSKDYEGNIIADTYDISAKPQYSEWTDGIGTRHHDVHGYKLEGKLSLFFRTKAEYNTFLTDLAAAKDAIEDRYTITVKDNKDSTDIEHTIYAFVEFSPVRKLDGVWSEYYGQIDLDIKEA